MTKAIALLSGGLDSILAVKVIQGQGIEVEAVNFSSVFSGSAARVKASHTAQQAADQLKIRLKVFDITDELIAIVKDPKHGHGSGINPCIDCHAFMFKKAGEYMRRVGASFLITGEVLGERPMSQTKRSLKIVEHDSGMEGYILRPLSAQLLEPTIPEKEGLVNRSSLLALSGRGRKAQLELAQKYGISDYPWPAGGCLLTERFFGNKLKDLLAHDELDADNIELVKTGRYFRLKRGFKLIVGRDEKANQALLKLARRDDLIFEPLSLPGPTALGRGKSDQALRRTSCRIVAYYTDKENKVEVKITSPSLEDDLIVSAESLSQDELVGFRR
jgi:tRNA-specific 2-thiouridylase